MEIAKSSLMLDCTLQNVIRFSFGFFSMEQMLLFVTGKTHGHSRSYTHTISDSSTVVEQIVFSFQVDSFQIVLLKLCSRLYCEDCTYF